MLRKYAVLFSPAPATHEPAAADPDFQPQKSGWIANLPSLAPVEDEPDKAKPAAATATPTDTSKAKAEADAKAASDKAASEKVASDKAATEKAAADKTGTTDKTADKPDDDEKYPRNAADWDKFKAKRKEAESKLSAEITKRETSIKELQTKLQEMESKSSKGTDPAAEKEIKVRDALIKEMGDRLAELEVKEDPRFKNYFGGKITDVVERAKRIVGTEKGAIIEKILTMPDSDYKQSQLKEFISDLDSDFEKSRLAVVVDDLEKVESERQSEIKKAGEHAAKLQGERKSRAEAMRQDFEKAFTETVKQLQDPEKGMIVFQKKEGDDAWNSAIDARVNGVKDLLLKKQAQPKEIVKAALDAAALPVVLEAYRKDLAEWGTLKSNFEKQIKEMTAAQPGGNGSGAGAATEKDEFKVDTSHTPHERSKAWAKHMVDSLKSQ